MTKLERDTMDALRLRVAELESQGRALADIAMQTKAEWESQRAMTVHRLGGMVEGAPTHAGNFLQRVDALREIERTARSLLSRRDFWIAAATMMALPGELDNLSDALALPVEPVASAAPARCSPENPCHKPFMSWPHDAACRGLAMESSAAPASGGCGAADHPVFVYPCTLPKGHTGPHDNGSGDPWFSEARP